MSPPEVATNLGVLVDQLKIFMWVFGIGLLPFLGWSIYVTWSLRTLVEMHNHPDRYNFGAKGLSAVPDKLDTLSSRQETITELNHQLNVKMDNLSAAHDRTDGKINGFEQVIKDNTKAMTDLTTWLQLEAARRDEREKAREDGKINW